MVSYDDFSTLVIILVFGVVGIFFSMVLRRLYALDIIVNEFVTGTITILDLQIGVIVLFFVVGIVVAAVKK